MFWEDQHGLTGVPKQPLCQTNSQTIVAATPLVPTPFVPFRMAAADVLTEPLLDGCSRLFLSVPIGADPICPFFRAPIMIWIRSRPSTV